MIFFYTEKYIFAWLLYIRKGPFYHYMKNLQSKKSDMCTSEKPTLVKHVL